MKLTLHRSIIVLSLLAVVTITFGYMILSTDKTRQNPDEGSFNHSYLDAMIGKEVILSGLLEDDVQGATILGADGTRVQILSTAPWGPISGSITISGTLRIIDPVYQEGAATLKKQGIYALEPMFTRATLEAAVNTTIVLQGTLELTDTGAVLKSADGLSEVTIKNYALAGKQTNDPILVRGLLTKVSQTRHPALSGPGEVLTPKFMLEINEPEQNEDDYDDMPFDRAYLERNGGEYTVLYGTLAPDQIVHEGVAIVGSDGSQVSLEGFMLDVMPLSFVRVSGNLVKVTADSEGVEALFPGEDLRPRYVLRDVSGPHE